MVSGVPHSVKALSRAPHPRDGCDAQVTQYQVLLLDQSCIWFHKASALKPAGSLQMTELTSQALSD